MKALVCGGRDYQDKDSVLYVLGGFPITRLIHGDARGADTLAEQYAKEAGIPCDAYPANWRQFGYRAGPMRNQQMLDNGKPDIVIAFPGGRGTADMVRRAKRAGVKVYEFDPILR